MAGNSRNSSFELLRIICMFFVVILHIINSHYHEEPFGEHVYFLSRLLKSFSICAVTTFVLISGYFGINSNIRKGIKYLGMVFFYSVVPIILYYIMGGETKVISFRQDFLFLLPVLTKRYWFATAYFTLFLLAPYYNRIFEVISVKESSRLMSLLLILFIVWPTICYAINGGQLVTDAGLGIVHLSIVYLLGRYLAIHYSVLDKYSSMKWLLLYVISCCSLFLVHLLMTRILGFEFESFFSYNTIFVLVCAVCLFASFRKLKIHSTIINYVASSSFSVYLFHTNPKVWGYVCNDILNFSSNSSQSFYCIVLMVLPVVFYLCSMVIEALRRTLFCHFEDRVIRKVEAFSLGRGK